MMPFLVLFDWDGTITEKDTLALVAPTDDEINGRSLPFLYYSKEYMKDYDAFKRQFGDTESMERLLAFMQDVEQVEQASIHRIMEGELFKGTSHEQRRKRTNDITFVQGWDHMAAWIQEGARHNDVWAYVISVNWSRQFVLDGLLRGCSASSSGDMSKDLREVGFRDVIANEVETDCTGTGTGCILGPKNNEKRLMLTGIDKLRVMRALQDEVRQAMPHAPTVFVGDSLTDLACILAADVGVLMKPSEGYLSKLRQVGMGGQLCMPEAWLALSWTKRCGAIILADDWKQVLDLLSRV